MNIKEATVLEKYYRSYMNINLAAIAHNLSECRKRIGDAKLLAVVKADGYGHGAVAVSRHVEHMVDYFAVACLSEAVELREGGIRKPILILGYTSPKEYGELLAYHVTPTIYSYDAAKKLSDTAGILGCDAKIHIAIDTGMGRIGFVPGEEDANVIAAISKLPGIVLEGMFTHFSKADETDKTYTKEQAEKYAMMVDLLRERRIEIPIKHCCNSAGIMDFEDYRYAMVRSGIITYGLWPSDEVNKDNISLMPAMEWKAHIVHVKDVLAGTRISYGGTFVSDKPMKIATVSVGYADGYPRSLSNKGKVLIHGMEAPILGRVCMDQMMVDVSHIPDVDIEDVVTLIGRDKDAQLTVEQVAEWSGRFNYEFVCDISTRVSRIYFG